jgi:hypothetical protein
MMIYMRNNRYRFKWLLAFIVIILVMTVTFDDVYGVDTYQHADNYTGNNLPETSPPPEVPEPATLVLLASGLVALRLMYRKKR